MVPSITDTTQITRGKSDKYDSPEWTPDGRYVLFTRGNSMQIAHVDGGTGTALVRAAGGVVTLADGDEPRFNKPRPLFPNYVAAGKAVSEALINDLLRG